MENKKSLFWSYSWSNPEIYPLICKQIRILSLFSRIGQSQPEYIKLSGHRTIRELFNDGIVRSTDRLFTVIRDPNEMFVSLINYILTRIIDDPGAHDSIHFAHYFKEAHIDLPDSIDAVRIE